ncbi:MAG: universal stress protein [Paracoccus sp. (in: a-proteobacteria)]|uniref:universal stress protein n=1 Tax=Paracoccus sp. TaxID=267 RepID=UPI0026DF1695|nr:universal stress protein [Paracoccus sp. (in: a-proteobacteria)]MDO5620449.1 universal stress protein [Paracoccus sp. (in: a-proteobacteria)]
MRKFLVLLDETQECLNAIRFAALRAAHSQGGVVVLSVIPAAEIQHGFGVADVMRAEAHERIESQFAIYANWMRDHLGVTPELVIQEGDPVAELRKLIAADPKIGILVLAAATGGGPDPVIGKLMRELGQMSCPITIVPGEIGLERLEQIT